MKKKWQKFTLAEVCSCITDGAHHSPQSVEDGYPMASVKDLTSFGVNESSCRRISEVDYKKLLKQGCRPEVGDVLIAKDGATALDTVCEIRKSIEVVLLSSVAILRPDLNKVLPAYLQYYLRSRTTREYMKNAFTTGAAIPRVVLKDLKRALISVPPMGTQREIASILSAYDDLIENNTVRIRVLEKMAQSLYREWFVHFRFPGHEKVKFVNSSHGKIPEGWEVAPLGDLYKTSSGGTPSRKIAEYYNGNIPWVKTRELKDAFVIDTEEKITKLGLEKSSAKIFPPNTILIAMYRATIGKLGILSVSACTNQASCAVLPRDEVFGFAFAYLALRENRSKLVGLGRGAAQQNINQIVVNKFLLLKPRFEVAIRFAEIVNPLLEEIKILQKKFGVLCHTRDLLLPKLISGEICQ